MRTALSYPPPSASPCGCRGELQRAIEHAAGGHRGHVGDAGIDRCAVLLSGGEQLLEAVDDEVGFQVVELQDPRITEVTSRERRSL